MSRAFLKDTTDERWEAKPSNDEEYRVYWGRSSANFDAEPVRKGDDFASLVRWAYAQPRGRYQIRDRAGRRLADIGSA